jgi:hypothetical protein
VTSFSRLPLALGLAALLSAPRERLRHKDKLLLAKLMSLNGPLFKGYLLKEQLRSIQQYTWRYLGVLRKRLEERLERLI